MPRKRLFSTTLGALSLSKDQWDSYLKGFESLVADGSVLDRDLVILRTQLTENPETFILSTYNSDKDSTEKTRESIIEILKKNTEKIQEPLMEQISNLEISLKQSNTVLTKIYNRSLCQTNVIMILIGFIILLTIWAFLLLIPNETINQFSMIFALLGLLGIGRFNFIDKPRKKIANKFSYKCFMRKAKRLGFEELYLDDYVSNEGLFQELTSSKEH